MNKEIRETKAFDEMVEYMEKANSWGGSFGDHYKARELFEIVQKLFGDDKAEEVGCEEFIPLDDIDCLTDEEKEQILDEGYDENDWYEAVRNEAESAILEGEGLDEDDNFAYLPDLGVTEADWEIIYKIGFCEFWANRAEMTEATKLKEALDEAGIENDINLNDLEISEIWQEYSGADETITGVNGTITVENKIKGFVEIKKHEKALRESFLKYRDIPKSKILKTLSYKNLDGYKREGKDVASAIYEVLATWSGADIKPKYMNGLLIEIANIEGHYALVEHCDKEPIENLLLEAGFRRVGAFRDYEYGLFGNFEYDENGKVFVNKEKVTWQRIN